MASLALNDAEIAEGFLQKALHQGYVASVQKLFEIYEDTGSYDNEIMLLEFALENFPETPDRPEWWVNLGEALEIQKKPEQALEVYQRGISEFPNHALLLVKYAYLVNKQYPGSYEPIQFLEEAISRGINEDRIYAAVGTIYENQKEFNQSISWFEKAIEINPNNPWWYHGLLQSLRQAGQVEAALAIGVKVTNKFPDFGYLNFEMGLLYLAKGDLSASAASMSNAIQNIEIPSVYYFIKAGEVFEKVNDFDAAVDAYERVLSIDSQNTAASAAINRLRNP